MCQTFDVLRDKSCENTNECQVGRGCESDRNACDTPAARNSYHRRPAAPIRHLRPRAAAGSLSTELHAVIAPHRSCFVRHTLGPPRFVDTSAGAENGATADHQESTAHGRVGMRVVSTSQTALRWSAPCLLQLHEPR